MESYSKLFGIIGIAIFIYLLFNIDIPTLLYSFKSIDYFYFFISLLFISLAVVLKSVKWLLIVSKEDRINLREGIFAWMAGFGAGLVTPGRIGDFFRAKFLKVRLGKSLLTVLIDRINDVLALFLLGIFSVFILFSRKTPLFNLRYLFILFFILFLILILVLRNKKLIRKIAKPFYKYFIPEKFKKSIGENFNIFYRNFRKLEKRKILINFLLTILAWFICFIQYWFLSFALGLNLSYFSVCFIAPILLLAQLIPISISGIGTREAASVLLLSTFGISPELAIAFSLGILIEDYILGGIGLMFWLKFK